MEFNEERAGEIPKKFDVFGFGHCCTDYLIEVDPFPEKGKKGDVTNSIVIGGGPVPTAVLTIVKFGCTAGFCGKIGNDEDGRLVMAGLNEGGVDTTHMIIKNGASTARAFIWIDPKDATRTIALDRTNISFPSEEEFDENLVKQSRAFLCDGRPTEACLKGLKVAREHGVLSVLDAGAVRPRFAEILKLVDYAVVSSDLADTLSPGATPEGLAEDLVRLGAGNAIVTIGAKGAVWSDGADSGHVPGFEVDAVDSTGAGDVFHGAFIFGLLKNWTLTASTRFANAAAALSCRFLSGRKGIPQLSEVMDFLNASPANRVVNNEYLLKNS